MVSLTDEQMTLLKEYAALFFTPREIAFMLGIPARHKPAFILELQQEHTVVGEAFLAARLQSEANIRSTIIQNAATGSKDAQVKAFELMQSAFFDDE
jgi:hypothetical protein